MKVGLLCSGGDCQSLNAMMTSICKSIYKVDPNCEIIGFIDGFQGLEHGVYEQYNCTDFFDLLYKGGTVLGTSRTSFKNIVKSNRTIKSMMNTYYACELECLLVLGGNGSHKTSNLLAQRGLNVISFPKTIDNDLFETDLTFGFPSAFDVASQVIECIQSTANSHARIFMVEIMGRKTGWLALHAGLACQADMILIPEIPFKKEDILEKIKNRDHTKAFVIVCAEGAISYEDSLLSRKELKDKARYTHYRSVLSDLKYIIKNELNENVFINIPGHIQRGGQPSAYDRLLVSRLGSYAGKMILNKEYGNLVAIKDGKVANVPLDKVAGKLKFVDIGNPLIQEANDLGISFGNEEIFLQKR